MLKKWLANLIWLAKRWITVKLSMVRMILRVGRGPVYLLDNIFGAVHLSITLLVIPLLGEVRVVLFSRPARVASIPNSFELWSVKYRISFGPRYSFSATDFTVKPPQRCGRLPTVWRKSSNRLILGLRLYVISIFAISAPTSTNLSTPRTR